MVTSAEQVETKCAKLEAALAAQGPSDLSLRSELDRTKATLSKLAQNYKQLASDFAQKSNDNGPSFLLPRCRTGRSLHPLLVQPRSSRASQDRAPRTRRVSEGPEAEEILSLTNYSTTLFSMLLKRSPVLIHNTREKRGTLAALAPGRGLRKRTKTGSTRRV